MKESTNVRRAGISDLEALSLLFDSYRQFYGQPSDIDLAGRFLTDRLTKDESIILIAERNGNAAGFTQLYPSFSSTRARRIFILNDLFVVSSARRAGVAKKLLSAAADFVPNSANSKDNDPPS